ncbi:hypothetical protein BDD30_0955 [Photorhabdus asymbiotica]|uniref:Uncharacterized protein n=1 Tax=Photorhabdus asymbiotica TaxID=291112 RepID=A0ABX9ST16_9GAMM|nr:hypothetical protein BDD30_0955 [Photorhabdus asymbiotica]
MLIDGVNPDAKTARESKLQQVEALAMKLLEKLR